MAIFNSISGLKGGVQTQAVTAMHTALALAQQPGGLRVIASDPALRAAYKAGLQSLMGQNKAADGVRRDALRVGGTVAKVPAVSGPLGLSLTDTEGPSSGDRTRFAAPNSVLKYGHPVAVNGQLFLTAPSTLAEIESLFANQLNLAEISKKSVAELPHWFAWLNETRTTSFNLLISEIDVLITEQNTLKPAGYDEAWNESMAAIRKIGTEEGTLKEQIQDLQARQRKMKLEDASGNAERIHSGAMFIGELEKQMKDIVARKNEVQRNLPKLTNPARFKEITGLISAVIVKHQAVITKLWRLEEEMVSWVVQRAVDVSDTQPGEFYQRLAVAAASYRSGVANDAEAIRALQLRLDTSKGSKNADAAKPLLQGYARRVQQEAWMTLPSEQNDPRGQFYSVDTDLETLGLEHLRADLPDRIPLIARTGHDPDELLLTHEGSYIQMYDLGLRTGILFSREGEVLAGDESVVVITHGVGTYNSTLSSVINWINALKNGSGETGDGIRRAGYAGFGEPAHGYGTRDPRFFLRKPLSPDLQAKADRLVAELEELESRGERESGSADALRRNLVVLHELAYPRIAADYVTAIRYRYDGYRVQEGRVTRPIILAGRSTGGRLATDHRNFTVGTEDGFDGYMAMSAYPNKSLFWTLADWVQVLLFVPAHQVNELGLSWFVLMANSMPQDVSRTGALILSMAGGSDMDYPHTIPDKIALDSDEVRAWVDDAVNRFDVYFDGKKAWWSRELGTRVITKIIADLRLILEILKPDDMTVDEYWNQIKGAQSGGLSDFWHSGQHGKNEDGQQEGDERELLFFRQGAYHNVLDDRKPVEKAEARAAMLALIQLVVGKVRHR